MRSHYPSLPPTCPSAQHGPSQLPSQVSNMNIPASLPSVQHEDPLPQPPSHVSNIMLGTWEGGWDSGSSCLDTGEGAGIVDLHVGHLGGGLG